MQYMSSIFMFNCLNCLIVTYCSIVELVTDLGDSSLLIQQMQIERPSKPVWSQDGTTSGKKWWEFWPCPLLIKIGLSLPLNLNHCILYNLRLMTYSANTFILLCLLCRKQLILSGWCGFLHFESTSYLPCLVMWSLPRSAPCWLHR